MARQKKRSQFQEVWRRLKKNKLAMVGMAIIVLLILVAIFAEQLSPYDYSTQDVMNKFASPSRDHWFGTDQFGRDIFTRVIYGTRISLTVGFVAVGIGAILGCAVGAMAAFYGGIVDNVLMRFIDIMMAIPSILLSIAISTMLGPGLLNCMIAVGISSIPTYARQMRSSILSVRSQEYIEAARMIGAGDVRIISRHLIPNAIAPVIVQMSLQVAAAILTAASLSFIGLGIQPPTPEWGEMLNSGRAFIREHPHVIMFPGMAIMLTVFSINCFGDGLRDALDPRLKN